VPEAAGITPVWVGFARVTTGGAVAAHLALDVECGAAAGDFPEGAAVGEFLETVAVLPRLACPPLDVAPSPVGVPPDCVPLPSVPPPPCGGPPPPPCSEVLTWRMAWRTGWTPSMTPAMTAIPASAVTSRSDPMFHLHRGKLLRRDRRFWRTCSRGSEPCQAQCPRQAQ
jgi:hypothetical protein